MTPSRPSRSRRIAVRLVALSLVVLSPAAVLAQTGPAEERAIVGIAADSSGWKLQVAGRDFLVRGMNWDYIPIGQNYSFDLWSQPEDVIVAALDREMGLMAAMGVNAIRVNVGIPPRWVRHIHDRYGIFSIVNHAVGRYGITIAGVWHPNTDYSDPEVRATLRAEVARSFEPYHGVRGVLMYLLGNENNYGLSWKSFEIEALPKGEQDTARARHLYTLFNEIAKATHAADPGLPVAMSNGDLQYIDVIARECPDVDIFGTNVYRGMSARDLYRVVREKLRRPILYTEFGCDAFNAREMREDQAFQARYLGGQWREIHEQVNGQGREGNVIGGCVFQWSDGWWKFGQTKNLDIHDTNASWPNSGYPEDQDGKDNNMNEEWWGICAKGYPDARGLYELFPRAAWHTLRQVFAIDPYAPDCTPEVLSARHNAISPALAVVEAGGSQALRLSDFTERVRVSSLRLEFQTISAGAEMTRPPQPGDPEFEGFDQFQTFYADIMAQPAPNVQGRLSVNLRGAVPTNTIDQIFYENRSPDKVKVYQANMRWDDRWFALDAYYRTGHYHWGYEGDFFGLYREANYGLNIDTYDAAAPVGFEVALKRTFDGLKIAFGPEVWWGAPPALLAKYRRIVGRFDATAMLEKDMPAQSVVTLVGSSPVALRPTTKTTLHLKTAEGPYTIEAGGYWGGANLVGDPFQVAADSADTYRILRDTVRPSDTYGGKVKLTGTHGPLQWYAQGSIMGLVAEAGPTGTTTITGWTLKDNGFGNTQNVLAGFAYNRGRFQVAPNFLLQKPIVGPMPQDPPAPGRLRNVVDDPFAVRGNREMTASELLLSYDPTPATWLHDWDNESREDASLAGTLGFVYRHMPTAMDAAIGTLADGVTTFAFEASTPARDLWEVNTRLVSRLSPQVRVALRAYYGTGEPNLSADPRLVERFGADFRVISSTVMFTSFLKVNDWGPYDFYRDYNLTYPLQLMGDLSHSLGTPNWYLDRPQTRIGIRGLWRSLDIHSLRYSGFEGDPEGTEWEVRTYLKLAI